MTDNMQNTADDIEADRVARMAKELFDPQIKRWEEISAEKRKRDAGEDLFQTAVTNWLDAALPGLFWFAVWNENKPPNLGKLFIAWAVSIIPQKMRGLFFDKLSDAKHRAVLVEGARRKRMGVKRGIYDLFFVLDNGMAACMELKWEKGRLSDEQLGVGEAMRRRGCHVAECWTGEEVEAAIRSWGLKPLQPFPRFNKDSKKQMRQQAWDSAQGEIYAGHNED